MLIFAIFLQYLGSFFGLLSYFLSHPMLHIFLLNIIKFLSLFSQFFARTCFLLFLCLFLNFFAISWFLNNQIFMLASYLYAYFSQFFCNILVPILGFFFVPFLGFLQYLGSFLRFFLLLFSSRIEISEISADISPIFCVSANIDTIFP